MVGYFGDDDETGLYGRKNIAGDPLSVPVGNDPYAPAGGQSLQQQTAGVQQQMEAPSQAAEKPKPPPRATNSFSSGLQSILGIGQGDQSTQQFRSYNPGATVGDYKRANPNAKFADRAPLEPDEDPNDPSSWRAQSTDDDEPLRGNVMSSGVSPAEYRRIKAREKQSQIERQDDVSRKAAMLPLLKGIRDQDPNYNLGRQQLEAIYGPQGGGNSSSRAGPLQYTRLPGGGAIFSAGQRPLNASEQLANRKVDMEGQIHSASLEATRLANQERNRIRERGQDLTDSRNQFNQAQHGQRQQEYEQFRAYNDAVKNLQRLEQDHRTIKSAVESGDEVVPGMLGGLFGSSPRYSVDKPKKGDADWERWSRAKKALPAIETQLQQARDAVEKLRTDRIRKALGTDGDRPIEMPAAPQQPTPAAMPADFG